MKLLWAPIRPCKNSMSHEKNCPRLVYQYVHGSFIPSLVTFNCGFEYYSIKTSIYDGRGELEEK